MLEHILNAAYITIVIVMGTMGMGYVIGKINTMFFHNIHITFGYKKYYFSTLIGVPMHELGHYIMCKIFGHKVTRAKFLVFDDTNSLGYIEHSYNKLSLRQTIGSYFISQGPLWTGSFSILMLMKLFVPSMLSNYNIMQGVVLSSEKLTLTEKIFELVKYNIVQLISYDNLTKIGFWIFLFIGVSIAIYSDMSGPDVKNALRGSVYVFNLVFLINILGGIGKFDKLLILVYKYNMWVISLLILIMTMSVIALMISIVLRLIIRNR